MEQVVCWRCYNQKGIFLFRFTNNPKCINPTAPFDLIKKESILNIDSGLSEAFCDFDCPGVPYEESAGQFHSSTTRILHIAPPYFASNRERERERENSSKEPCLLLPTAV